MFTLLDYAEDIIHALKVGVFLSFAILFLTIVSVVIQTIKDENENNQ
jgi:hypothetical protein